MRKKASNAGGIRFYSTLLLIHFHFDSNLCPFTIHYELSFNDKNVHNNKN
jgi:hypothetical protein